ncbi:MAG: sulfite exporter TauE/SafE family protein [Minwuia sp.]|uniref:sulfite exporter TauE/SafE family protein n=1 Tax=Minwuia sp. TaxID=2493630 RepID=UPI003A85EB08
MIAEPVFYAVAVPVLLLTGIGKGGFGSGVGIVAVPTLSLVIPPLQAVAIMLPILCLMDIFGVWSYRRQWSRRLMLYLGPGAVIGIGIATALAGYVDEHMIRLIIGAIAVLFSLNYWLGGRRNGDAKPESRPKGVFWSAVSGFTSFVGHAGGPPLQVYMLPLKLDKTVFVGTTTVFFMLVNYAKIVPYGYLGLLTQENLLTALVLAPICPLAMFAGVWLHHRIPERPFYLICYVFVFIVGLKLLRDGIIGTFGL